MRIFNRLEEIFLSILIAGAVIITALAVTHRYLAGFPIPYLQDWLLDLNFSWAQELTIYMFIWMAKFGAAYGVRTGIHVGVDVIVNQLDYEWHRRCIVFSLLSGVVFTGIVAWFGSTFVWENGFHYALYNLIGADVTALTEGPTSPDLGWPTWIVYSAVPLGSTLMSIRFLQVLVNYLRTDELPHHDHSHVDGIEEDSQLKEAVQ